MYIVQLSHHAGCFCQYYFPLFEILIIIGSTNNRNYDLDLGKLLCYLGTLQQLFIVVFA